MAYAERSILSIKLSDRMQLFLYDNYGLVSRSKLFVGVFFAGEIFEFLVIKFNVLTARSNLATLMKSTTIDDQERK